VSDPVSPANSVDDLPEWAQKEIRDLRSENANHRAKNKELADAREQLERDHAAKLEELQATVNLTSEHASQVELQLANTSLAVERGLPLNVVPMIVGSTDEERTASADALAALRSAPVTQEPQRQTDPAQAAEPAVDPRQQIADAFFGNS